MKIAIVGGGICGLSTYLFLVKNLPSPPSPSPPHTYVIYEAYETPRKKERVPGTADIDAPLVGGGIGVGPNGMKVLRDLSPKIHADVVAQGFPSPRFQFKNSHGWTLGSSPTVDLRGDEPEIMVMSSRQGVWEQLRENIPDEVLVHTAIREVKTGPNGNPVLTLSSGKEEEFDIVIGADGLRSIVRKTILGDQDAPYYTGIYGVGGFMPTDLLPPVPENGKLSAPTSQVIMTFSADGFFGYTPCSTSLEHLTPEHIKGDQAIPPGGRGMWWSTFTRDDPDTRNVDNEEIRQALLKRHEHWKDPTVNKIVKSTNFEVKVATWVMPKSRTWCAKRMILVGDAAHTLPSSSGQGVSQALEDAQALSLLLQAHFTRLYQSTDGKLTEEATIQTAFEQFEKIRKPHVEAILDAANKMGDTKRKKGFVGEYIMYFILYIIFTFFPTAMSDKIQAYDVKAQVRRIVG